MCLISHCLQARLRNENNDMSQRVGDLSSSVQSLCTQHKDKLPPLPTLPTPSLPTHILPTHNHHSRQASLDSVKEEDKRVVEGSDDSEDDQSFEDYCKTVLPLIGERKQSTTSTVLPTTTFPVIDIVVQCVDDDPKQYCLLNNTSRNQPKASSTPLLNQVHNDLNDTCKLGKKVSSVSDSVLVVPAKRRLVRLSSTDA